MKKAALSLLGAGALAALGILAGPAGPASAAAVTIDLYTATGTTSLPGAASLPVWGYRTSAGAVTQPGGPVLTVDEGDTVTITLHNGLSESTGLLLQGQRMVPDRSGVSAGGTKTYSFTASDPGTYLYEAALLPNAQHQVAMGLYGALVVRPAGAPGQAYGAASTAFDDQAVLLLSEIDPALNNAGNKATFDMRKFAPRYFLVNGRAHPATTTIPTTGGRTVLLRYVNAGIQYHSMSVLGAQQRVIALDGSRLDYARRYVAETFGPGQTADALVTAPAAATDTKLSVYDGSLQLHNSNTGGIGGMLTSIDVAPSLSGGDTTGPITTAATLTGTTLTAHVDDSTRGGADVQAAEYFLDTVVAPGDGTSMSGAFTSAAVDVTATSVSVPSGQHVLYLRGQDSTGNWGPLTSVLVSGGDANGPVTRSALLAPRLTNHANTGGVAVSATGDDSGTGGSNITAAEYWIDGGSHVAMTVNTAAPVASLDATIPASVINGVGVTPGLAEGTRVVSIRSQDAGGTWGAPVTVNLVVDVTPPTTGGVSVSPTPNNGTLPVNTSTPAVRVTATSLSDPISSDVNSPIGAAEVFIDTVGANGSGIPLGASDGVYNDPSEGGYADIPLSTVKALSNGPHTLSVHAKDAAGNWGAFATTTLLIDKVGPAVSGASATPNPTQAATSVTLTASATDTATAITQAEWFTGTDPGFGNGTPMAMFGSGLGPIGLSATIDVSSWNEGSYALRVRAKDTAGNWGTTTSTTLAVTAPLEFSTFGSTNPPGVTGTADDADIYGWSGSAFSRVLDMSAAPYNLPGNANVDGFDRVSPSTFYLSFSGATTTVPGLGAVQDEDVLFWNGTTWSVWFDGTAHGLTAANQDIDAISVVGSTLYFSTVGNTNPPGVGGAADDADIYSWNGSSYARVWDATANGLAGAANVDGLVFLDSSHFYLSFSPTTTTVPVLGAVEDEDVVYNNGGTWKVYFDGTAHGLTAANLDVDAFDVP